MHCLCRGPSLAIPCPLTKEFRRGQQPLFFKTLTPLTREEGAVDDIGSNLLVLHCRLPNVCPNLETLQSVAIEAVVDAHSWLQVENAPADLALDRVYFRMPLLVLTQCANYFNFLESVGVSHESVVKRSSTAGLRANETYDQLLTQYKQDGKKIADAGPMLAEHGLKKEHVLKAIEVTKRRTKTPDLQLSPHQRVGHDERDGLPRHADAAEAGAGGPVRRPTPTRRAFRTRSETHGFAVVCKLYNRFARALNKPPVMVAGMTSMPSLEGIDLVAAIQNAGFHGELAAGGLSRPNIFEDAVNELVSKIKSGLGIAINMLYLNAK
ncbi:hypothetical protein PF010_g7178 [Phytophthora fragariae]|uniref:Uncharacterized protein n=1 Tax=Phytophthora fragariae TaxID=53985 RepID=A0A6G0LI81_9STRA|nr:hypothetical protein PF010_g7178 [Phytophthora fragariae]